MDAVDLALFTVGLTVLVLGLFSGLLRQSMLSESLLALVAGVVLGPAVLGILHVGRLDDPIVEEVTRVTLAIGLMGVALRLSPSEPRRRLRALAVLLLGVMPLMWIVSALLIRLILGLSWPVSFLLGAVITPTDPVVVSTLVTGPLAHKHLPARLRHLLSAESGFNDGLAHPLVMLPLFLGAATTATSGLWGWFFRAVGIEVFGAAILGIVAGYAAGRLLDVAERHHAIEKTSLLAYSLALSLVLLGLAGLVGVDALLTVFIGGLAFDRAVSRRDRIAEAGIQEAVHRFFSIPIFLLLGAVLPWDAWREMGWRAPALVAAVLVLRRLPAVLLLGRFIPEVRPLRERFFLGWFGPIGVASLYYAGLVHRQTAAEEVLAVASLMIVASVLVHGVTAAPVVRRHEPG
jgi:sodium/hydrogen antiporter